MLLRAQRLELVCAGSMAPGTPLRILVLARSDLLWLGSPDPLWRPTCGGRCEVA